jgi:HlyD family secretion protein
MKSKIIKAIITGVIVIGVGFGGFYGYNKFFGTKEVVAAVQYYTASARKMNLELTVQGTGSAYAAVTKDIMPNNNGTLGDLTVKVGDSVTAEQKLFVSDSDDVRKNVTNAKNNLNKQNLNLAADQSAEKIDENKIAQDKLAVSEAKTELANANKQYSKMTVTSPIGGIVTAVNNSNGDSVQSGKSVLTVVDMNSIKVKVAVDELNIGKIKEGQKAQIKFDAIADKTYEGAVEEIAIVGTTSNNVTTYDVVVAVKDPAGIKLGMNANVTIAVESKENALVIPAEALVENNGQKFVRVENVDSTTASDNSGQAPKETQSSTNQNSTNNTSGKQTTNSTAQSSTNSGTTGQRQPNRMQGGTSIGTNAKLVAIKTGMETENYIEVIEGLNEGQRVLIQLPQTSTTTTNNKNNMTGGFAIPGMNGGMAPAGANGGQKGQRN